MLMKKGQELLSLGSSPGLETPRTRLQTSTTLHRITPFTTQCWFPRSQDDDPYVRKTAAICVAKLYDISPELVEDRGFLDMLRVRRAPRA
jgi:hypothetical protein